MNTSDECHVQSGDRTLKARSDRGNTAAQLLGAFKALLKPRGYDCRCHQASIQPHLAETMLSRSRRYLRSSVSLHPVLKEWRSHQSHLKNAHNAQNTQGSTGTSWDLHLTFQGARERIFSAQTSRGLGLALLNHSGDFPNMHLEASPQSLQLLEEWVLLSFNEQQNLFRNLPPFSRHHLLREDGTCSEVGDTSYCNTLEPPRSRMLFSFAVIVSSNILWDLKYWRLKTCNLLTKQNQALSAASLPTGSLETHFFHSSLGTRFIQLPVSTRALSSFQSISPPQQSFRRSMDLWTASSFCSLTPRSNFKHYRQSWTIQPCVLLTAETLPTHLYVLHHPFLTCLLFILLPLFPPPCPCLQVVQIYGPNMQFVITVKFFFIIRNIDPQEHVSSLTTTISKALQKRSMVTALLQLGGGLSTRPRDEPPAWNLQHGGSAPTSSRMELSSNQNWQH